MASVSGANQPKEFNNYTYGVHRTAVSASKDLDIAAISAACDNINDVAVDGFSKIAADIGKVNCGAETLIVQDKTMEPVIEEVSQVIKGLAADPIEPLVEDIRAAAIEAYNTIQTKYNSAMETEFNNAVAAARRRAEEKKSNN